MQISALKYINTVQNIYTKSYFHIFCLLYILNVKFPKKHKLKYAAENRCVQILFIYLWIRSEIVLLETLNIILNVTFAVQDK